MSYLSCGSSGRALCERATVVSKVLALVVMHRIGWKRAGFPKSSEEE
jgi:hypothetical protein